MTGPEHFRRAEELAAEAHKLLGQGDGQATAGVWAAVVQTHAVRALPAAAAVGTSNADSRAWADLAGTRLQSSSQPARPCTQSAPVENGDRKVDAWGSFPDRSRLRHALMPE